MNIQKLCIEIATKEDGNEVVEILKKYNLWDVKDNWRLVGYKSEADRDLNNHSIIGNQQANPANALVEKLSNCGDSALMLACQEKGINPMGEDSPNSLKEAVAKFFGVIDGRWINTSSSQRRALAEKYCNLVVTGEKGQNSNPTYTIIDTAEGQEPHNFDKTFLSLTQKNKTGIGFLQGKFGMGSYGAVNFCKVEGLQLILSKRNPALVEKNGKNLWGFTLVRKIKPSVHQRSSSWVYLIIDDQIPSFEASDVKLLPGEYPNAYGKSLKHGSYIKLYNYDIGPSLRSAITFDLNYKLNTLLFNPIVPVRLYERRKFKGHSFEATLDGLETRLDRDRSEVLANGFPSEFVFNVENQRFKATLYVYKKYSDEENGVLVDTKKYGNGVLFCVNGQSNGRLPQSFFDTGVLKYENIKKNILVVVDCSEVLPEYNEQLFQTDRERIYDNSFTKRLKDEIAEELSNHEGLRKFQNQWRRKEILSISDNKNTKELFNKLLKDNRNLLNYLFEGTRLHVPFGDDRAETEIFQSEFYPTVFKLTNLHSSTKPKIVEEESQPKISLVTNAPNNYFTRPRDPGSFRVFFDETEITDSDGVKLSGFDGKWRLVLPARAERIQKYRCIVNDIRDTPFEIDFFVKLKAKNKHTPGTNPKPPKPPKPLQHLRELPSITQLHKADFEEYKIDEKDMLSVEETQGGGYNFNLNMDNSFVLNYLKGLKDYQVDLAKEQYKVSMSILGLVLIEEHKHLAKSDEAMAALGKYTTQYTRSLAPVIMYFLRDIAHL